MSKALIVVDVQNDFITGSLPVPHGDGVAERINQLIERDNDYDYVVSTQDWHIDPEGHFSETPDYATTWPVHCMAESEGAALHDSIKGFAFDAKFGKGTLEAAYSGFEGVRFGPKATSLDSWLADNDVSEVDVCGLALDYCVKATALDAIAKGYRTRVLLPFTAAVTPETGLIAKFELETAGVEFA